MATIRWGIIGCGDVTEIKSGPGFQKARDSSLVAVMRRNGDLARDYAERHGVPRWYDDAGKLLADPEVDAVYVATPPATHKEMTLMAAAAGKPILVEKPMATTYEDARQMVDACKAAGVPLFVAYYRRALPLLLKVKEVIEAGAIGAVRSVSIRHFDRPLETASGEGLPWRVVPEVGGGGIFVDMGSHALDFVDFLFGPIKAVGGFAANQAGLYEAEDVVSVAFTVEGGVLGTGEWCFGAYRKEDRTRIVGAEGEVSFAIFDPVPVVVTTAEGTTTYDLGYPRHVHQPLIQTVVDDLNGTGRCPSTGDSGARANRAIDAILREYREARAGA